MNILKDLIRSMVILLALFFIIGAAYAWREPASSPPNPDPVASSPITTSTTSQTKSGDLTLNNLTVTGGGVFGGEIRIGSQNTTCSTGISGAIRYNSTTKSIEICDSTNWKSVYAVSTTTTIGNGNFTCDADKCVATCEGNAITLGRNQSRFCTTTGTITSRVFGTQGGSNAGGYLNATINKKNSGWVNSAVNYSVICDFFERSSTIFMLNCADNYGTSIPWSTNIYTQTFDGYGGTSCNASYRNYSGGTNHTEADFSNINCTSSRTITGMYSNNSCTTPTTVQCYEATDTNNNKYNVRNNVTLNFGNFPANWSSINTNF